jgi:response regulator RpfG family c-di-GMP phosphodiesterase
MERVLVVDDDVSITEVLSKVLKTMGFEVVTHTDPREAVKETGLALILTDYMMPHLSGVEVLQKLGETNPDAVRLLLTAANEFGVAMQGVNDGRVFRILAKPWTLQELRRAIEQSISYYRVLRENQRLSRELAARNEQLTALNASLEAQVIERTSGLLQGMIRALDFRDTETQWHSWRVAKFTRRIAEAWGGFSAEALQTIEQGALLHDIGKIGVSDTILLKPGPLTPEEWVEMKKHPAIGWRLLGDISYLRGAADIVYQHQERWDGKGYPRGLKGEEITVGARIFCVADTLDAITSDRPYRKGSPLEVALTEIGRLGGTQFDPRAVEAFLSVPRQEWLDIRAAVEALEEADKRHTPPT